MHYTVSQVSALTGIAPDTLRAWERRYGVVTPVRTESRYRLYDEHDIERLRLMARLVGEGAPASLAAQEVEGMSIRPSAGDVPVGAAAAAPTGPGVADLPAEVSLDTLVTAARNLDRSEVDAALDRSFSTGSFESVAEHWLLPALAELGAAWADGRIDVAGEHLVSGAVRGRLGRAFDAAGTALGGSVVLVGLPPGSLHELGSLTFAICLRRLGADVRWLGADLPVESWAHAADRTRPSAAVITVPTDGDLGPASAVVARLRARLPDLPVFLGGSGARDTEGVSALPASVTQAARQVLLQLRDAQGPSAR